MTIVKRVLLVQIKETSSYGGVESFVDNLFFALRKKGYVFDYLYLGEKSCPYEEEIIQDGGSVYYLEARGNKLSKHIRFYKATSSFLGKHRYDIVHINNGSPIALYVVGKATRRCIGRSGMIILHAHSARPITDYRSPAITMLLKEMLYKYGDVYFACSDLAASRVLPKRIYTKKIHHLIPNAIPLDNFAYKPEVRCAIRKKLGIDDSFVVGHVGRFSTEKNHKFLIDVFADFLSHNSKARLLLIGGGYLADDLIEKVKKLGIEESVIFAGVVGHDEINEYYNAMDLFLLPSMFEGFPMTVVEAQATGLPIVASDSITKEIDLVGLCTFVSLNDTIEVWKTAVENASKRIRRSYQEELRDKGYDISDVASYLSEIYYGEK